MEREEEQLLRRCDEYINSILRCDQSTYTLTVWGSKGSCPAMASMKAASRPRPNGDSPVALACGHSISTAAMSSPCGNSSPATGSMPTVARSTSPGITWGLTKRPVFAPCGWTRKGVRHGTGGRCVLRSIGWRSHRRLAADRPGPCPWKAESPRTRTCVFPCRFASWGGSASAIVAARRSRLATWRSATFVARASNWSTWVRPGGSSKGNSATGFVRSAGRPRLPMPCLPKSPSS